MTREEMLNELKARNKRKAVLHEELLRTELYGEDADPVRTAIANNYARMNELFAMLGRIESPAKAGAA